MASWSTPANSAEGWLLRLLKRLFGWRRRDRGSDIQQARWRAIRPAGQVYDRSSLSRCRRLFAWS